MEEDLEEGPNPGGVSRQERDDKVCKLYGEDNLSAERVAEIVGISAASVRKIAANRKIKKKPGRKPPGSDEEKVHGPSHVKVGVRLHHFLHFVKPRTTPQAAEELGWSALKLSAIGKGHYDLSLTDITKLASYMGISASDLLKDL